jgi:hypothetical protein
VSDVEAAQPGEDEKERVDRELIELLNEIRVVLSGAQVLFAFLLAVPFQSGWNDTTELQQDTYFAALCLALLASALLITPSALHRLNFRRPLKQSIVVLSGRLAVGGIVALGSAMSCVMVLIADVLFGGSAALAVGIGSAALLTLLWIALPLAVRRAA